MLSRKLLTLGLRLAHKKSNFKGPILRAPREPEYNNSMEVPQAEKTASTMQLPAYIDPKFLRPVSVNEEQQQDEKHKSYDYKYHSYSLYDLNEATTRLAAEQSKKKAKNE